MIFFYCNMISDSEIFLCLITETQLNFPYLGMAVLSCCWTLTTIRHVLDQKVWNRCLLAFTQCWWASIPFDRVQVNIFMCTESYHWVVLRPAMEIKKWEREVSAALLLSLANRHCMSTNVIIDGIMQSLWLYRAVHHDCITIFSVKWSFAFVQIPWSASFFSCWFKYTLGNSGI